MVVLMQIDLSLQEGYDDETKIVGEVNDSATYVHTFMYKLADRKVGTCGTR